MTDRPPLLDYGKDDPPEEFPRYPKSWKPVIALLLVLALLVISIVLTLLYATRNGS